jgi:hypothetical protein
VNLGQVHDDVKAVIARGGSQDAKVPRWVRSAAQWLEQNYSFQYMEKFGEVYLDPQAVAPNVLTLPNNRVKLVTLVQPFTLQGNTQVFLPALPKVDRAEVLSIGYGGIPAGWWQVGDTLHFDTKPDTQVSLALVYEEYSAWPVDANAEPTLVARYDNLLLAQALVNAWRELKDTEAMALWTNERDMALRAILNVEEENRWKGQDLRMQG